MHVQSSCLIFIQFFLCISRKFYASNTFHFRVDGAIFFLFDIVYRAVSLSQRPWHQKRNNVSIDGRAVNEYNIYYTGLVCGGEREREKPPELHLRHQ